MKKPFINYVNVELQYSHTYHNEIETDENGNEKEVLKEEIDPDHIVATDFTTIPFNCCVKCKKERKPFEKKYEQWQGYNCYLVFSYESGYCEQCAAAEVGAVVPIGQHYPNNDIKSEDTYESKYAFTHVTRFSDGSVFEQIKEKY